MPIQNRNLAMYIVLTIVTCGLFGIYWFIVVTDDVKSIVNDNQTPSGGVAFLLTLVTCGIYRIYWAYKMGEKIDYMKSMQGMPSGNSSILFLILEIFRLQIVNLALIQDSVNKFVDMNNRPNGNGPMGNGTMNNF